MGETGDGATGNPGNTGTLGHPGGTWKLGNVDGMGGSTSDGMGGIGLELLGATLGEELGRVGAIVVGVCGTSVGVGVSGGVVGSAVGCESATVPGTAVVGTGRTGTTGRAVVESPLDKTMAAAMPAPSSNDATTNPSTSPFDRRRGAG